MWSEFRDFFTNTELSIPAIQMIFYVVVINILMLFNRCRVCFVISLSFALYWLFILNKSAFVNAQGELTGGIFFYLTGGIILIVGLIVAYTNFDRN